MLDTRVVILLLIYLLDSSIISILIDYLLLFYKYLKILIKYYVFVLIV